LLNFSMQKDESIICILKNGEVLMVW